MPSSRNASYDYEVRNSEETPFQASWAYCDSARRPAYCGETSVECGAVVKSSCDKGVHKSRSKHVSYCLSSMPLEFQLLLNSPRAEYLSAMSSVVLFFHIRPSPPPPLSTFLRC